MTTALPHPSRCPCRACRGYIFGFLRGFPGDGEGGEAGTSRPSAIRAALYRSKNLASLVVSLTYFLISSITTSVMSWPWALHAAWNNGFRSSGTRIFIGTDAITPDRTGMYCERQTFTALHGIDCVKM